MDNKKPRRIRLEPHPDPKKRAAGEKIKALALDFKIMQENWNVYELEDGTRVRIRASAVGFTIALEPVTEKPIYDPKGEPLFGVQLNLETKFEPSDFFAKKG